ncbi:unnamed protein product [Leuciscus chuanchicus]
MHMTSCRVHGIDERIEDRIDRVHQGNGEATYELVVYKKTMYGSRTGLRKLIGPPCLGGLIKPNSLELRGRERESAEEQEKTKLPQQYKDSHVSGPKTNCHSFLHLEHQPP